MSKQYCIYNHKTKKRIYGTQDQGNLEPKHLIGDIKTIFNNLKECNIDGARSDRILYYIYIANAIKDFANGCVEEDLEIIPDDYFIRGYKNIKLMCYMLDEDLIDHFLSNQL